MTYFELLNRSSGNRIGKFDTEDEALNDVWTTVKSHGRRAIAALALVRNDEQGNVTIVAEGDELVGLAGLRSRATA
jgi:hypothetical protein